MAGRYLLIACRDAETADQLEGTFVLSTLADHGIQVMGQYYRPDRFCHCPDKQRIHVKNWFRGNSTGIPVCITCHRPSKSWRTGMLARLEHALGKRVTK